MPSKKKTFNLFDNDMYLLIFMMIDFYLESIFQVFDSVYVIIAVGRKFDKL